MQAGNKHLTGILRNCMQNLFPAISYELHFAHSNLTRILNWIMILKWEQQKMNSLFCWYRCTAVPQYNYQMRDERVADSKKSKKWGSTGI